MKRNYTVLITKHQSLQLCKHFPVFLLVFFLQICQVPVLKKLQTFYVPRPPRGKYFILFKKIADTVLFLIVQLTFRPNFVKLVNSTYPVNSFEEEPSYRNPSASFCLQKNYKHVTPSVRILSTQGSHRDPPANDIIET